jgi:hypothetical protein
MIRVVYKDLGDNKLHSQNWYEYLYPKGEPYRQEYHTYEYLSDTEVAFKSFNMNWEHNCDYIFTYKDGYWTASQCGECIVKGNRIVSEVKFNQQHYLAKDAGYNPDGQLIFGKDDGGPFIFDRV